MALMINGKKVVGYALGGTEFYSIGENADGSITYKGYAYGFGNKASDSIDCDWSTAPYGVSIALSQKLSSNSGLTLGDLINKGEKIRLTVTFLNTSGAPGILNSGIIDFSKPDSEGHFNFQWINGATSTNTYCYFDSSANKFYTCSDAISAYLSSPSLNYDNGHMKIFYSDES